MRAVACAAAAWAPVEAGEPSAPSAELLEFLGEWHGDEVLIEPDFPALPEPAEEAEPVAGAGDEEAVR